jgi:cyclopropane-fatty-acyl-phospholipid synthase
MKLIPDSLISRRWFDALSTLEFGSLKFVTPDGEVHFFQGRQPGAKADFHIRDWDVIRNAAARGDIGLGEDYIDGAWETSDIEALFSLFLENMDSFDGFAHGSLLNRAGFVLMNALIRRNSVAGSQRNIKAHYDVGNDFYRLWLDETMTYSSALYGDGGDMELSAAQRRKYGRILDRFDTKRASVLEIGCGWGGFAESAANAGHDVTAITVSPSQHKFATDRLKGDADIRLEDYRRTKGTFDRIASIEMLEAVGERYWPNYFHVVSERLRRGGRALVQTITIRDELFSQYRTRSDFVRHYVFPGGMLPSLKRIREEAERAGLRISDSFSFGQDYARTLREWSKRLKTRESEVLALGYDSAFLRNWHFYLGICAATFAVARTDVVQVEFAHA